MAFLNESGNVVVSVPPGQKIAIGSFGNGVTKIKYSIDPGNKPESFYEATRLSNNSVVLGTFPSLRKVEIESGLCEVEYVIAVSPVLTRKPYNPSNVVVDYVDSSGAPGNVTNNSSRGRAAFAAAGNSVTVTSNIVTAASSIFCQLQGSDATLTSIRCVPGAGSFVVTGNAAATGITKFDFFVIN